MFLPGRSAVVQATTGHPTTSTVSAVRTPSLAQLFAINYAVCDDGSIGSPGQAVMIRESMLTGDSLRLRT